MKIHLLQSNNNTNAADITPLQQLSVHEQQQLQQHL